MTEVGPTWGDRVSRKALTALVVFFVLIAAYLTFRFEWRMALAAIVAVVHDIVITVGCLRDHGLRGHPGDGGRVPDDPRLLALRHRRRVRQGEGEHAVGRRPSAATRTRSMVNRSLNQVLMRSINTSFVALLPVASLLVVGSGLFGAVTLRDFALALFVGLLVGAYSSIFVATPILAWLKEREPRYRGAARAVMAQQLARVGADPAAAPAVAAAPAESSTAEGAPTRPRGAPSAPGTPRAAAADAPPAPPRGGPVTPRGRQQRRRKRR